MRDYWKVRKPVEEVNQLFALVYRPLDCSFCNERLSSQAMSLVGLARDLAPRQKVLVISFIWLPVNKQNDGGLYELVAIEARRFRV